MFPTLNLAKSCGKGFSNACSPHAMYSCRGLIINWLHHDHRDFESAVYRCRTACDMADWSLVQDVFAELVSSYRNHVRIEEEVLLHAYEEHPGASIGPADSLRADHEQILHLMDHIEQLLADNARDNLSDKFSLLYRIVSKHHEKEEEIFLPMASEALHSSKNAILADMQNQSARDIDAKV